MFSGNALRMVWLLATALLVSLSINVAFLFRFVYTCPSTRRARLQKAAILLFTAAFVFCGLELGFSCLARSDGVGVSLASRQWFQRYWTPINRLGYRDDERKDLSKRLVFIVGDSLVAGHGIEHVEARFADRLTQEMGGEWEKVVIAQNGWDTRQEFEALVSYPARPEIVVLSYFVNDIDGTAARLGRATPPPGGPGPLTSWAINRSYLLNWAYWRAARRAMTDGHGRAWRMAYDDPLLWETHRGDLQRFIDYSRDGSVKLCVVIWPQLTAPADWSGVVEKVANVFRSAGVPVLDLALAFAGRSPEGLVVNAYDAHPNAQTHGEVAHLLHAVIQKQAWLGPSTKK